MFDRIQNDINYNWGSIYMSANSGMSIFKYPNPFNPTTTIAFELSQDSKVIISIYNIKGQKVKTLTNKPYTKGAHSVIWNGKDKTGKSVSSGVYFYKITAGKNAVVKKMLLLK